LAATGLVWATTWAGVAAKDNVPRPLPVAAGGLGGEVFEGEYVAGVANLGM
jgi:hypothetical protein